MKKTLREAIERINEQVYQLRNEGFICRGTVTVTELSKESVQVDVENTMTLAADSKYGVLRLDVKARVKLDPVIVGDGIVRDGSICTTCSGTAFERRGSCLYCTNCGTSVGGCG